MTAQTIHRARAEGDAVVVRDLVKEFRGGARALDGVSFSVPYGCVSAYVGRNGAGKTTTVRILCGLAAPSSGSAAVAGVDVVRQPAALHRVIGASLQDTAVDGLMSGREHLQMVVELSGMRRSDARVRAGELLDTFGLAEAAGRLVKTYSGGMRRRLDLAMALMHQPRVVFMDEPTGGLDPQSRIAVRELIRTMRDGGCTVFLTTHDLREVEELADRVTVIDRGRIVTSGTPAEIRGAIGERRAVVGIAEKPVTETVEQVVRGAQVTAPGVIIVPLPADDAAGHAVLAELYRRFTVRSVRIEEASLEDAFLRLTSSNAGDMMAQPVAAGVAGGIEQ